MLEPVPVEPFERCVEVSLSGTVKGETVAGARLQVHLDVRRFGIHALHLRRVVQALTVAATDYLEVMGGRVSRCLTKGWTRSPGRVNAPEVLSASYRSVPVRPRYGERASTFLKGHSHQYTYGVEFPSYELHGTLILRRSRDPREHDSRRSRLYHTPGLTDREGVVEKLRVKTADSGGCVVPRGEEASLEAAGCTGDHVS